MKNSNFSLRIESYACTKHSCRESVEVLSYGQSIISRLLNILCPESMIIVFFISTIMMCLTPDALTQSVGINDDGSSPNNKAILDIKSTTMGMLVPRMDSVQKVTYAGTLTPGEAGMMVYDTDENLFFFWDGSAFMKMNAGATLLMDADGDTKMQVEESMDEDVIRFDLQGTERWVMTESRLEPKNSGGSVFIGEGAGENDDLSDNTNVGVGSNALHANTSGPRNTALGNEVLYSNTTGYSNSAVGDKAMYSNTMGFMNTAVGAEALHFNTDGQKNSASGVQALYMNTTGSSNTSSGFQSLRANIDGFGNTANGVGALYSHKTGHYNTAIGYAVMYSDTAGYNNSALGTNALRFNKTGNNNTASGYAALYKNEIGFFNVAYGARSLYDNTSGSNNAAIGSYALYSNVTGHRNVAVGIASLYSTTDRSGLVAVGDSALYNNGTGATESWHAGGNTALGARALLSNSYGWSNTATGNRALYSNTIGGNNSATGREALANNTEGERNTAMGRSALFSNIDGDENTATGVDAMKLNTSGFKNTVMGRSALHQNTTGSNNVAVGRSAMWHNETGSNNVAIGIEALGQNTDRSGLVAIGDSALFNNGVNATHSLHAAGNTAVGSRGLLSNEIGFYNTAIGSEALRDNVSGANNVAIGSNASRNNQGDGNTIVGAHAGSGAGSTSYAGNVFIGTGAGSNETNSNRLYISNIGGSSPLIYGEFDNSLVKINGQFIASEHAYGDHSYVAKIENTYNANSVRCGGLLIEAGHSTYNASYESSLLQFDNPAGGYMGRIKQVGTTSIALITTSDERLKHRVSSTRYGLKDLMAIQVKDYYFQSDEGGPKQTGFLAQQLYQHYPDAVDVGGDDVTTQPWGVAYGKLTPLLVKSIQDQQEIMQEQQQSLQDQQEIIQGQEEIVQEQQEIIEQQEDRIAKLEYQVSRLTKLFEQSIGKSHTEAIPGRNK